MLRARSRLLSNSAFNTVDDGRERIGGDEGVNTLDSDRMSFATRGLAARYRERGTAPSRTSSSHSSAKNFFGSHDSRTPTVPRTGTTLCLRLAGCLAARGSKRVIAFVRQKKPFWYKIKRMTALCSCIFGRCDRAGG